jgi:transcriptional regulator with XRE-family HTH domain
MKADILKNKAILLRRKGFSFREISDKLGISKSTASLWLRGIELSERAEKRIEKLGVEGRKNARNAVKERMASEDKMILKKAKNAILKCALLENDLKIICALLYWCEGGKTEKAQLTFTNSDPRLVKYFIDIFRKAFIVDEGRFRVLLHVHGYHDVEKQIEFWSRLTKIKKAQFTKPYKKPNTGKRIRNDYQGCVSVRYYGREMRQEMMFLVEEISNNKYMRA